MEYKNKIKCLVLDNFIVKGFLSFIVIVKGVVDVPSVIPSKWKNLGENLW